MKNTIIQKNLNMKTLYIFSFFLITLIKFLNAATPPKPYGNILNEHQLRWFKNEMLMFAHFGIKTFYPNENHMGLGNEDPQKFNPTKFDANQWIEAIEAGGFGGIVFTAKHHDGFCNWPTTSTDYNISASPYKDGNGDLLKEVSEAFHNANLWFGVYLSSLDNHYKDFTSLPPENYNEVFQKQLLEICSNYGKIDELWFDGFGKDDMIIDPNDKKNTVVTYQPQAVCFGGPINLLGWPKNEEGFIELPNWGEVSSGNSPWEADCIAQGNWFYNEDNKPMVSLEKLKEIYLTSVGRGAVLLLNVAPNQKGLIDQSSINRLEEFGNWIKLFSEKDIARFKTSSASNIRENCSQFSPAMAVDNNNETYWTTDDSVLTGFLDIDLETPTEINAVVLQEYIPLGQRIDKHSIKIWNNNTWEEIISCSTIGYKRIHEFDPVITSKVRLEISGLACPIISTFSIKGESTTSNTMNNFSNASQSILIMGKNIHIPDNFNKSCIKVSIHDLKGRLLKKIQLENNNNMYTQIQTQNFGSGIYLIKLQSGNKSIFQKCVIR